MVLQCFVLCVDERDQFNCVLWSCRMEAMGNVHNVVMDDTPDAPRTCSTRSMVAPRLVPVSALGDITVSGLGHAQYYLRCVELCIDVSVSFFGVKASSRSVQCFFNVSTNALSSHAQSIHDNRPFVYFFFMDNAEKRKNFLAYFTKFRLIQLHVFNILFAYLNGVVASPPRELVFRDFMAGLTIGILYILLYLTVLDRLGVHIYPIFSPRSSWVAGTWLFMISGYVVAFYSWRSVLTPTDCNK